MKKVLLFLAIVLFSLNLTAQSKNTQQYVYCELVGTSNLTGTKVTVAVDYGDKTKFGQDTRMKGADGKPIKFNSMVDAMNYMGVNGWEFVQAYVAGTGNVYHWLLKKTIEISDAQMEEVKKAVEE